MDTPKLYEKLSKALLRGDVAHVFSWLPAVANKDLREAILTMILTDREMYRSVKTLLQAQIPLSLLLHYFCNRLEETHQSLFVSFSAGGCTSSCIAHTCKTVADADVLARFYVATTLLCRYAMDQGAEFILVGVSSVHRRVKLIMDTDVPVFSGIGEEKDAALCMAQNHICRIGAEVKGDSIGLSLKLFRLMLGVEVGGRVGLES